MMQGVLNIAFFRKGMMVVHLLECLIIASKTNLDMLADADAESSAFPIKAVPCFCLESLCGERT
jgi:hypothetical protein